MSRSHWAVLVAVVAGLAGGCGCSNSAKVGSDDGRAALTELGQMLKDLASEGRKPPARAADLEAVEPMIPVAGPSIRSGELVYVWGAGYAAGGNQVVAYEKKVATEGGYVLLQDGTVKQMTADEFKGAPKAGK
jgi:hypothetical protein